MRQKKCRQGKKKTRRSKGQTGKKKKVTFLNFQKGDPEKKPLQKKTVTGLIGRLRHLRDKA